MLVDLASLPVLAQQAAEDTLAPHPEDLGGHAGLGGTLPLSGASVAPLGLGLVGRSHTGARVDHLGVRSSQVGPAPQENVHRHGAS